MKRREIVGILGAVSVGLSGCLGEGDDPETDDRESETENDCPPRGTLEVRLTGNVPDDRSIVAAKEASLTENEYISRALERASDKYEDGMEDELATEDSKRLARVGSSEEMAADGDVKDEVGWDGTYVAYEGVTYELAYLEAVC